MVSAQSSAQQAGNSCSLGSFDEVAVSVLGAAMDSFSLPASPCVPGTSAGAGTWTELDTGLGTTVALIHGCPFQQYRLKK